MSSPMQIIRRSAAKNAGVKYYFTGRACTYGHIAARQVSNGTCVVCRLDRLRRHRATEKGIATSRRCAKEWRRSKGQEGAYRQKAAERAREWYKKNKRSAARMENAREREKRYAVSDKGRAKKRAYKAFRMRSDLQFKLRAHLRSRFLHALRGKAKASSVIPLIGCSIDDFRSHIETQFLPGMSWDNWTNRGDTKEVWHIDHRIPLSKFDLSDASQASEAWHYTNMRPLWAFDNLSKGAR